MSDKPQWENKIVDSLKAKNLGGVFEAVISRFHIIDRRFQRHNDAVTRVRRENAELKKKLRELDKRLKRMEARFDGF